jgi:hypothetical protein
MGCRKGPVSRPNDEDPSLGAPGKRAVREVMLGTRWGRIWRREAERENLVNCPNAEKAAKLLKRR